MNGRIYDPLIGRFLSADLVVQFPGDLQSYNRYSYVQNNPLRFTDPSGFTLWEKVWGIAAGIVEANLPDAINPIRSQPGEAPDVTKGRAMGNILAFVQAGSEISGGGTATGGGIAISVGSGGTLSEFGVPISAVGGLAVAHGTAVAVNSVARLATNLERVKDNEAKTGSDKGKVDPQKPPSEAKTKGGTEPNNIGKDGQAVTDQLYGPSNNETFEVNGRTRKPDHILAQDAKTGQPVIVEETKNVSYQHMSTQLKDDVALVGPDGKVVLTTPADGKVSKTVENHPQIEVRPDLPPKKKPGE